MLFKIPKIDRNTASKLAVDAVIIVLVIVIADTTFSLYTTSLTYIKQFSLRVPRKPSPHCPPSHLDDSRFLQFAWAALCQTKGEQHAGPSSLLLSPFSAEWKKYRDCLPNEASHQLWPSGKMADEEALKNVGEERASKRKKRKGDNKEKKVTLYTVSLSYEGPGFRISTFWIPESIPQWIPNHCGFRIPPTANICWIPDCGFSYMGRFYAPVI